MYRTKDGRIEFAYILLWRIRAAQELDVYLNKQSARIVFSEDLLTSGKLRMPPFLSNRCPITYKQTPLQFLLKKI